MANPKYDYNKICACDESLASVWFVKEHCERSGGGGGQATIYTDGVTVTGSGTQTDPLKSPRQGMAKYGPAATADAFQKPYDPLGIYLVGSASPYAEYMVVGGELVETGSTDVDLSNYYTKDQSDAKYQTLAGISTSPMPGDARPITSDGVYTMGSGLDSRIQNLENAPETDPVATLALNGHINDDDMRWQVAAQSISELRAELKQFVIDTYAGTTPTYDYSQAQTILQAGGLINLADQGSYTIPTNGAIQAQVGGLLGAGLTVTVNGAIVWTAPVNLLVSLSSPEIQVNAGDVVAASGIVGLGQTINIDYYPNKGT